MKKYVFILFFFLSIQAYAISNEELLKTILGDVHSVISETDNEILQNTWNTMIRNYNVNKLHFIISNAGNNNSKIGTNQFSFDKSDLNQSQKIFIDEKLLDLYPEHRPLVLAIFFHEFRHACDFYTNPEGFVLVETDLLEEFLYEMDAFYVEALFLEELYKINNVEPMTQFEKIIRDSNKNDNLKSFSMIMNKIDTTIVYRLRGIGNQLYNKDLTYNQFTESCLSIGTSLLDSYDKMPKGNVNWENYYRWCQMNTFIVFMPRIIQKYGNLGDQEFIDKIKPIQNQIDTMVSNCANIHDDFEEFNNEIFSNLYDL